MLLVLLEKVLVDENLSRENFNTTKRSTESLLNTAKEVIYKNRSKKRSRDLEKSTKFEYKGGQTKEMEYCIREKIIFRGVLAVIQFEFFVF